MRHIDKPRTGASVERFYSSVVSGVIPLESSGLSRNVLDLPSIVDVLAARAEVETGVALRFLADGEGETEDWTYQQLRHASAGVADWLREGGHTGRPVVLALEPGLRFVAGLFG